MAIKKSKVKSKKVQADCLKSLEAQKEQALMYQDLARQMLTQEQTPLRRSFIAQHLGVEALKPL